MPPCTHNPQIKRCPRAWAHVCMLLWQTLNQWFSLLCLFGVFLSLFHTLPFVFSRTPRSLLNSLTYFAAKSKPDLKTKHYIKSYIGWNFAIGSIVEQSFLSDWMPSSDFNMHYSNNGSLITSETRSSPLPLLCPPPAEPGSQKSFKRKRSLINWPFWRGSSSQLDGLPLSPTSLSPTQGRLFGRPLSAVCSPDHGLPKPVMVSWAEVT